MLIHENRVDSRAERPKMIRVRLSRPGDWFSLRPSLPRSMGPFLVRAFTRPFFVARLLTRASGARWIGRSVARQAGASVFFTSSLGAGALWWLLHGGTSSELTARSVLLFSLVLVPTVTVSAAWATTRFLGARLGHLVEVIDSTGPNAELTRIRDLGSDEVGAIAQAVNRLLARITSIRASMIDQQRELIDAQRALKLKADLAEKTSELSQRLEERAMLFEILRMTSTSPELSSVLSALVERVGQLLHMREAVLFLFNEEEQTFSVEAAYGVRDASAIKGRLLALGEGLSGKVGHTREPLVVPDLSLEPDFHGFWGNAERSGSLAAVPIASQEKLLGVLSVTRAENDPISDTHLKLLCAIADNAALAIRNAQLFERMRELSTHDELTGLANRRLLRTHLDREIDRARRFHKAFALLVLDIDHFKYLNDRHGHPCGDAALREVAALLASHVRKVDSVARVGGEEFMVLLPRTDAADARLVAEKLRSAIVMHPFAGGADQPGGALTVSIGVTDLSATDDERGESMIARADQALYAAKHAGRNRVCVAEAP
jgi:diguanylate cyclase (GGDEF)-like protein